MTDKETAQWFDTIFYSGRNRPIMLATRRERAKHFYNYLFPAYDYAVVDQEELERCTFYKSERHDIDLIYTRTHMGLRTGNVYVQLGMTNKDVKINVCEGSGLLCISCNETSTTYMMMYDIRHGIFIYQRPVSQNRPSTEAFRDKVREIVDNNRDVTATEMYRQLVIWSEGTSIIHIYDTEKDWTLVNSGYLSPENIYTLSTERPKELIRTVTGLVPRNTGL